MLQEFVIEEDKKIAFELEEAIYLTYDNLRKGFMQQTTNINTELKKKRKIIDISLLENAKQTIEKIKELFNDIRTKLNLAPLEIKYESLPPASLTLAIDGFWDSAKIVNTSSNVIHLNNKKDRSIALCTYSEKQHKKYLKSVLDFKTILEVLTHEYRKPKK